METHDSQKRSASNQKRSANNPKCSADSQKRSASNQKCNTLIIPHHSDNDNTTCSKCGRCFKRSYYMKVHMETCTGTGKGCCEKCNQQFTNRFSLYRHRKGCQTTDRVAHDGSAGKAPIINNNVTINIGSINNSCNTNTNMNTVNVLPPFPIDDTTNFDFITDQITKAMMKKCVSAHPAVGFKKFMTAIFDNPLNMLLQKTNPNISYSKVHMGDGEWQLEHDSSVFPIVTHHMTTAAIAKATEFERSLKYICENFLSYVRIVNENDEAEEYKHTLQNLKFIVVNMTKKLETAEKSKSLASAGGGGVRHSASDCQ